ncbi:MAG: adenylate/guanylate cyclase domain-containing protein [Elusimicrobia bacterium]|nr:adenylate/guanylate cyclase domain-containing protein [Elusimicrobiota bacterium]
MRDAIPMRRELKLESSPEELWPLISNTGRFNKALGLPAMTQGGPGASAFATTVRARLFGIPLSWKELPFEWVEGRFFKGVREFDGGPIARFEGGIEFIADGRGCTVKLDSTFTPRNALGGFLVKYVTGRKAINGSERLVRAIDQSLKAAGPEPFPVHRVKTPPRETSLKLKSEALHAAPVDQAVADRLISFLRNAYDDQLSRMRPYELADLWGFDRCKTLKVCLQAVKAGLLDMNWDVLCPNCGGPKENIAHLKDLKSTAHCPACGIEYGVNMDQAVEVRFTVSPAVRPVDTAVFCVGNPSKAPFALAQLIVGPGRARSAEVDLKAESYRLRDLASRKFLWLRPSVEAPSTLNVDMSKCEGGCELRFKPGTVKLILQPATEPMLVRLEKESWKEKGATACGVTALQEFRDLFSSEVLAPGVEIAVKNIAVLFSDLKGSTALYESIGDATAYSVVRDHFDYMFAKIAEQDGAVVKTIGDAVMAVFPSAAPALEAALEIQEHVAELNARLKPKPAVVIKLGLHMGPAIAINANEVLDYFGTTVNVGARVQNESKGGDVVITQAVLADAGACQCMAEHHPTTAEDFEIRLKGLSQAFKLRRLIPKAP